MNKTILLPSVLFHLPTIKLRWRMMHLKQLHLLAETQYVHLWRKSRAQLCGWVSLVKAKISLNPTPNILKQNMASQKLSSVRQFLHKTQLLVFIIKETLKYFII